MPELPSTADPVPATPIGDMQQWQLHVRCARCRNRGVLPLEFLAEQYGRRTRIADLIQRLRCGGFHGPDKCRGPAPGCCAPQWHDY